MGGAIFMRRGLDRQMLSKTCTRCEEQQREPLCWTVAAWQTGNGVRVAYKHRLCLTCLAAKIAPLQVHSDTDSMTCPACGIDTTQDMDPVFITWIPKRVGELKAECPFCSACAARFRLWFQEGSLELEDRNRIMQGRPDAPAYEAIQVLESLGIKPRA